MTPIHTPTEQLRQKLQADIDAFLAKNGKIKQLGSYTREYTPPPFNDSLFETPRAASLNVARVPATRKTLEPLAVKFCGASGLYHIYQGKTKLPSSKGFYNNTTAEIERNRLQKRLNKTGRL